MVDSYLGEIRIFAGNYAPEGWALCNGASLPIAGNEALYSLIGNVYGGTSSTFNLPNLNGRVPIGSGQGTGLTARALGQTGGASRVPLTTQTMPQHTHALNASNTTTVDATSATPGPSMVFAGAAADVELYADTSQGKGPASVLSPSSIGNNGGSQPHQNMMPYTVVNYIISTSGLYPSSS